MRQAPRALREAATVVDVGLEAEVLAGGRALVDVGPRNTPVLIVKTRTRVFAMENRCPHAAYPLEQGSARRGRIRCALHSRDYDMASGLCRTRPGARPLVTYRAWVERGRVMVALPAELD